VNGLRELRASIDLGQRELAALLVVPLETLRTWDSGRRPVPIDVLHRARVLVADYAREHAPLPLAQLARDLGVHIRTLQAAARSGRLDTTFSVRSIFGRPCRRSSRAAGKRFLVTHYRCFSGQALCDPPLAIVPPNYDQHLRDLRRRKHLTQRALARRIGAANKAVIYQWESRKRRPSPVLWARVLQLDRRTRRGRGLKATAAMVR
jgi:DNA-binding transcriptional regulator YiaG